VGNAIRFAIPIEEAITVYSIRHPRRTFATLGLAVLLVATGCSDDTTQPTQPAASEAIDPGPVDLPHNPDPPREARMIATLVGDPELDGGCVWLRQGAVELSVLWPPGFTAEFNPARVMDAAGNVVAQEGDQVELTGSFAADPKAYEPHRCTVGSELWLAAQVHKSG
jgi:hypothetical protein